MIARLEQPGMQATPRAGSRPPPAPPPRDWRAGPTDGVQISVAPSSAEKKSKPHCGEANAMAASSRTSNEQPPLRKGCETLGRQTRRRARRRGQEGQVLHGARHRWDRCHIDGRGAACGRVFRLLDPSLLRMRLASREYAGLATVNMKMA